MRTLNLLTLAAALALTGCSTGAFVQRSPAGTTVSAPSVAPAAASVSLTLTAQQTAAVRAYYGGPQTRGRGRGNGLPPGIEKNLARGKPLPPGIAKQSLPGELVVALPRLENGLDYVVAAGKLLLVETATQVVRQVLIDALYS